MSRFGVSYRSTLLSMRRLETEGCVVREPGSGTYVKGVPTHVQLGAGTRTMRIIFAAAGITELFLRPLIAAIQEELSAMECNHSVVVCPKGEVRELLVPGEADVFGWVCPDLHQHMFPTAPEVPVVCVAQDLIVTWPQRTGYDMVTADHLHGGHLAGAYLKEVGANRPVVVGVWDEPMDRLSPYTAPRLEGFQVG